MVATAAVNRRTFAEKFFECPHARTHTEIRGCLPTNGARGEYDPGEEWEVEICDDCGEEVKPVQEIDWSQVMEMPY
jgi:hypothetical protein